MRSISAIYIPKRKDDRSIEEHSRHFYVGVFPSPQRRDDAEELRREVIVAQGYDRVNMCGEHKERMGKGGGEGGL